MVHPKHIQPIKFLIVSYLPVPKFSKFWKRVGHQNICIGDIEIMFLANHKKSITKGYILSKTSFPLSKAVGILPVVWFCCWTYAQNMIHLHFIAEIFSASSDKFESLQICPHFADFEFTKWNMDGEVRMSTCVPQPVFHLMEAELGVPHPVKN